MGISGTSQGSYGSMLELTWRGRDEIKLSDGDVRKFLKDHDTLNVRGFCGKEDQARLGFGDCSGQILPAGAYDGLQTAAATKALSFKAFELHSYWRSTCSWRVRIALAFHNIDFATKPVHLLNNSGEQHAEAYKSTVNPMSQVPALSFVDEHGDKH